MKEVTCPKCKEINIIFFESIGYKQCFNCEELIEIK